MDVTLFYKGKLKKKTDVEPFLHEVEDICCSAAWEYTMYDGHEDDEEGVPFQGITFQPHPECESVLFLFHKDGRLANLFFDEPDWGTDNELSANITKTHLAGADTHIALCRLFEYLFNRWFDVFEIHDDSGYYETKNRTDLERRIGLLDETIDILSLTFTEEKKPAKLIGEIEHKIAAILEAIKQRNSNK